MKKLMNFAAVAIVLVASMFTSCDDSSRLIIPAFLPCDKISSVEYITTPQGTFVSAVTTDKFTAWISGENDFSQPMWECCIRRAEDSTFNCSPCKGLPAFVNVQLEHGCTIKGPR